MVLVDVRAPVGQRRAGLALLSEQKEPGAIAAAVIALLDPAASVRDVANRIRAGIEAMPTPADIVPQLGEAVNLWSNFCEPGHSAWRVNWPTGEAPDSTVSGWKATQN